VKKSMWLCVVCGERENEDPYRFCFSCGAPKPAPEDESPTWGIQPPQRAVAAARPDELEEAEPTPPEEQEQEQEHGFKLPKALTSLGQRLRQATASGGDHVISVRVSPEVEESLELLLQAGRFDSQADAAGFLLEEGAKAQAELLQVIRRKLSEIERLREELRGIGKA
jgi:Arc/MetJ-type ribon-helix-helix transcriptional regulator